MHLLNIRKDDLNWLNKALNKKDLREYRKTILVKDGYAYATNGHVIHKVKCAADEQNGVYSKDGTKIDTQDDHPLLEDMFNSSFTLDCTLSVIPESLGVLKVVEGVGLNTLYFDNAVAKASKITIKLHENKDRVYIHYDNREVIIMGTRL